jgi:alpha-L-rhamnosidase
MEENYMTLNYNRYIDSILGSTAANRYEHDERVRTHITPQNIIWKTENDKAVVENYNTLLEMTSDQITLNSRNACILRNNGEKAGILLDFGFEIQGGIKILVWGCSKERKARLRIRFGESAMEAMSEIGHKGSCNDHASRDQVVEVQFLSGTEIGNTGFRFVRIDLLDENTFIEIKSVKAVLLIKDIEYKGSFECSDELLNKIWKTGAYTVHLNMQNYLWDGIKRDRLVWIGDMYPETSTIQAVFGYDSVVPKSLDLIREETKLPGWMNGIPTYSMWWILIHHHWFMQNGDKRYLEEQKEYLVKLLHQLSEYIDEDGRDITPEGRFIDWPSSDNKKAVNAGVQAMHILAVKAGAKLCEVLGEKKVSEMCLKDAEKLKKFAVDCNGNKQAAALMALSGIADKNLINDEVLAFGGAKNISTFLGYFVLRARAFAGDIEGSLNCIREYWGGMLKLGATTFWEDFNIEWLEKAARIDELASDGKVDVHGDYGNYCYKGYRHSLCHGWASGPTPWLSEYVLGVKVLEPGCKTIKIEPQLGDLTWAQGTYPTPKGIIHIRHEKQSDGSIISEIKAPEGIKILK